MNYYNENNLFDSSPFDDLCLRILEAKDKFYCETGKKPKCVFLGFAEMKTFAHIPPWHVRRMKVGEKGRTDTTVVADLEAIQVIKDSFLMVA